ECDQDLQQRETGDCATYGPIHLQVTPLAELPVDVAVAPDAQTRIVRACASILSGLHTTKSTNAAPAGRMNCPCPLNISGTPDAARPAAGMASPASCPGRRRNRVAAAPTSSLEFASSQMLRPPLQSLAEPLVETTATG